MANNKANTCKITGIVSSDITNIPNQKYGLTFKIKVYRPAEVGKIQHYDELEVVAYDSQNTQIITNNLTRGIGCCVHGEVRVWYDKTVKILARKIDPIY